MEQQETSSFIIQCMNPFMGSDSFCLILQFTAVMSNYCHFSHFSAAEIEIGHSYGACLRENGCVCCPFFFSPFFTMFHLFVWLGFLLCLCFGVECVCQGMSVCLYLRMLGQISFQLDCVHV